ncbi:MAG TPA: ArsR family transcriptional regulator [Candidatus Bathyarchaeota archaeon]|nr:ArsR family transcriptional regulator [Candidatus Bathyarchaeota archaeon]
MNGLARRIVDALNRGPMLFGEIRARVDAEPKAVREALEELVRAGLVRRRRSGRFWIYWLDGDGYGHLSPADWEMVEGLTVLQVLEEASRLS